jgi:hyperosmotically inducible periplasmic protein
MEGRYMARYIRVALALVGSAIVSVGAHPAAQASLKAPAEVVRKELMQLPYYGVFDFIAFNYNTGGVVMLMGYAYHPTLRRDAERAVRRASTVTEVSNKIEELPASSSDDELRWKIYYAIYRDPFLARYAPGGGTLWGHRHTFGLESYPFDAGSFSGMEAAGDYPIHIIVKNQRVTLVGVVDNEGDKTIAGVKAKEVSGSFGVDNNLMVEKTQKSGRS